MLMRIPIALLLAVLMIPYLAEAELKIEHRTRCEVWIWGEITADDAENLKRSDCRDPFVRLFDSPGGDVGAGMRIGRWIRENQAPTSVELNKACYSTCALIFIAGVERYALGEIGLHRPYLAGAPQARQEISALVSALRDDIRAYVTEMGVRPEFASVMLETLPEQMRLYDGEEIHELVAKRDAVYDEMEAARNATFFGVSTDEYRRRQQEADRECDIGKFIDDLSEFTEDVGARWENCERAILWGLTESVYLRRIQSVPTRCAQMREAGSLDGYRKCRISVMRGE